MSGSRSIRYKGLSLSYSDRQWLAEHLVEPEEIERAKERKRDEEWVRELMALIKYVLKRKGRMIDEFDTNSASTKKTSAE